MYSCMRSLFQYVRFSCVVLSVSCALSVCVLRCACPRFVLCFRSGYFMYALLCSVVAVFLMCVMFLFSPCCYSVSTCFAYFSAFVCYRLCDLNSVLCFHVCYSSRMDGG